MCRVQGPRCDAKWDENRRKRDNARRRYAANLARSEAGFNSGDSEAGFKYFMRAGEASEEMGELDTAIADHMDATREVSTFEASMASSSPEDRAATLQNMGVPAQAGDTSVEYSLGGEKFSPDQGVRCRDPYGEEPDRVTGKPIGGVWTAPDSGDPDEFQSTLAGVTTPDEDSVYTQVRGSSEAVVVTLTSREDVEAMGRVFPTSDPKEPFSFSSARDAGVDAIRVQGPDRDLPLEDWDTSSTVWLSTSHMEVGEQVRPGAERCPDCGQWEGVGHDCSGAQDDTADEGGSGPQIRGLDPVAVRQWRESLTEEERDAWEVYGSFEHYEINEALRGAAGDEEALQESLGEDGVRTVRALDSALARAPRTAEPHVVYRAFATSRVNGKGEEVGFDSLAWADQHPAGTEVTFHGFTSTSTDESQIDQFSGALGDYTRNGLVYTIETTQSGKWTDDSPEQEVTLARGTRFEVVSVDREHTLEGRPYPRVHLREVV